MPIQYTTMTTDHPTPTNAPPVVRVPKNQGGRPITIGRAVKAYAQTVKQLDQISADVEATLGITMSRAATMAWVVDRYLALKGAEKDTPPPGT